MVAIMAPDGPIGVALMLHSPSDVLPNSLYSAPEPGTVHHLTIPPNGLNPSARVAPVEVLVGLVVAAENAIGDDVGVADAGSSAAFD